MNAKKTLLGAVAAIVFPTGAIAGDDFNYTYLDLQYLDNGIDESYTEAFEGESLSLNLDGGSGFAALGSIAINRNWHVFADYAATDVDLRATGMVDDIEESLKLTGDVDDWRLGIGFNAALNNRLDVVARLAWEDRAVDFGSVTLLGETTDLDVDDDGLGLMVGLRGNVSEKFELNGSVRYSQVLGLDLAAEAEDDILDNDVLFGIGGIYHIDQMFSLGASAEVGDSTAWHLFARVGFTG